MLTRAGRSLFLALLLAGAVDDEGRTASLVVGGDLSGSVTVDSADELRELAAVAFRQRRTSHCLAFAASSARAPSTGLENAYQLGFVDTDSSGADFDLRQWLDFVDNPGVNDASQRQVSAVHVDDGVPRGRHTISWAGTKNAGDEDLEVTPTDLTLACAKWEIPWRDAGRLPPRARAAIGGYTGPDAPVTSVAHYDELAHLGFTLARPQHCVALASGVAFNPGGGLVDNAYQLVLTRTGEAAGFPSQRIELDDNAGAQDANFLPVSAVRFLPELAAGEQEIRWLGIKGAAQTANLIIGYPTLALVCARDRLGPEPVSGRTAVGGAHLAGEIELADGAVHELVALDFMLNRSARCAAFASAWATNPGGGTVDNVYRFGLHFVGVLADGLSLEFDDNPGFDDVGALPVALTGSWDARKGEHSIRFIARKDDAGDADLRISSPSLAVVCGKATREP